MDGLLDRLPEPLRTPAKALHYPALSIAPDLLDLLADAGVEIGKMVTGAGAAGGGKLDRFFSDGARDEGDEQSRER